MSDQDQSTEPEKRHGLPMYDVKCIICGSSAAAIIYTPNGCTCAGNSVQPRCHQHMLRVEGTDSGCFVVIEDLTWGGSHFKVSPITVETPPD